jgi:hypothetical protein
LARVAEGYPRWALVTGKTMGTRATSPSRVRVGLAFALLCVVLLTIVALALLRPGPGDPFPSNLSASGARIAYFQFDSEADTLWIVDSEQPSKRESALVVPHATDFGVIPSLAPDGRHFVYGALPPGLKAPTADTPAGLWLTSIEPQAPPQLIARDIDLLIPAVWSPDGRSLVFRRSRMPTQSAPGEFRLVSLDLVGGQERVLVPTSGAALFPVALSPDATLLYFVRLEGDGSHLATVDMQSGVERVVAKLSDGLTRDWRLSPRGDALAYLAMDFTTGAISSSAFVFDLNAGAVLPAGEQLATAFGPIWTSSGELIVGYLSPEAGGSVSSLAEGGGLLLPSPARGFDVPLAVSPAGERILVRSFNGASVLAPGRSVLAVLRLDGSRTTIASGEVTFLGWINP